MHLCSSQVVSKDPSSGGKLANEWVVQPRPRLPFLHYGKFKACEERDRCPDIEILLFSPKSKCQLGMDKFVMGELEILQGAAVFTVQHMM